MTLARDKQPEATGAETAQEIERLKRQLEVLDQRLDNIDSMVTAIAERVMKQPVTFNASCPRCGREIEIALVGVEKPGL
jgi:transposase-like protein